MKLIVTGASGRMGGEVVRAILSSDKLELIGASLHETSLLGKDIGGVVGSEKAGVAAVHLSEIDFKQADAIIDFTLPDAMPQLLQKSVEAVVPLVTGTTGLTEQHQSIVDDAATKIPIVQSFNMSIGVTLLSVLVEKAAAALDYSFDIEINESHHRNKKDAPSGTALLLGKAAANARGVNLENVSSIDRNCERKLGDIGFSVQRGGAVIGDHSVMFMGDNERIELTHKSENRCIYADGAIKAAHWVQGKQAGLYSMRDVLGI